MKYSIVISILACLFPCLSTLLAQENKYKIQLVYKLEYQPDSLNEKSKQSEDFILLLSDNKSIFKSINLNYQDSINTLPLKNDDNFNANFNASFALMRRSPTNFRYTVIKDSTNELKYRDKINNTLYEYPECRNCFNWEISDDTITINGFHCQKAMAIYAGRKWTAWFSPEIAFSDGPYKFNGLPGLIIKINDSQNYYSFTLTAMDKKEGIYFGVKKQPEIITKEKYYSSLTYYLDNQYELMAARGVKITSGEDAVRRGIEERRQKNNNPLELVPVK